MSEMIAAIEALKLNIDEYIKLSVQPEVGGDPVTVSIHVPSAFQFAVSIWEQTQDPTMRAEGWNDWLVSNGVPRLSYENARGVLTQIEGRWEGIVRECTEWKGKIRERVEHLQACALKQAQEVATFLTEELPKRKKAGLIAKGGDGASATGIIPGFPRGWKPSS